MKKSLIKVFSLVLTVCMLFSTALLTVSAAGMGSLSGSPVPTVSDARSVLRAAVRLDTLSAEKAALADIDFDSAVTVADAREILRIAVKLDVTDGKTYANEYEVLCSGHFFADMTFEADGEKGNISYSVTADSLKVGGSIMSIFAGGIGGTEDIEELFGEFKISSMLVADGKISIISDANKEAISIGLDDMTGGTDADSLLDDVSMFGSSYGKKLSDADKSYSVSVDGKTCRAYDFNHTEGVTTVVMDGKKIVKIEDRDTSGKLISSVVFNSVSCCVPSSDISIPSDYEVTDLSGINFS